MTALVIGPIGDTMANPRKINREESPVLVSKGLLQSKSEMGVMLFGMELRDHREELFVVMVCDGLPLGVAFRRAGFSSKDHNAPSNLFALPRLQERAQAILKARATTGVVSLGEVTSMLQRVFAGAHAAEEFSAAHNAAFSLARLYGHVTDRATLEVIRRPSRDPDAPSEQALGDWVAGLPALNGPGPGPGLLGSNPPLRGAPAAPLGQGPAQSLNEINDLQGMSQGPGLGPSGPEPHMHVDVHRNQQEFSNEINDLAEFRTQACIGTGARPENGAPTGPVTVTPNPCGPSGLLGNEGTPHPGGVEKGAPLQEVEGTTYPKFEDLF